MVVLGGLEGNVMPSFYIGTVGSAASSMDPVLRTLL